MKTPILVAISLLAFGVTLNAQLYFPPITGSEWQSVSKTELGWCQENLDSLSTFLSRSRTKGFIILVDGRIAYEQYFGDFKQTDYWYWASAGKSLTSLLVGIAQQEKLLALTDQSNKYIGRGFTSLSAEQEDKITILNQLTMTSGLDDKASDPHCTEPSCLVYKADAGTRWAYHNAPYTLLDTVLLSATGMGLNLFLQSRVKQKTGMDGAYFKQGFNNVMVSTTRSAARFGLLMLNDGKWMEDEVISDADYVARSTNTSQDMNKSYGYLWWLNGKESFMLPGLQLVFKGSLAPNAPADMYSALGKNDQVINVAPSKGMVVVRLGDAVAGDGSELSVTFTDQLWAYINALSCPTSVSGSRKLAKCGSGTSQDGDFLLIRCGDSLTESEYVVYSLTGVEVLRRSAIDVLDISGLQRGVYVVTAGGADSHHHLFVK